MRVGPTARRALGAALEMALASPGPVTVAEVARRRGEPEPALAKVLQRMVRAGLAVGHRGVGGGYRLAGDPSGVTVAAVLAAFEAPAPPPPPPPADPVEARMEALFREVDETARCTFASVSLATLARGRHGGGIGAERRGPEDPAGQEKERPVALRGGRTTTARSPAPAGRTREGRESVGDSGISPGPGPARGG